MGARKLSVIITAAAGGKRMKSYGAKALIDLGNGETVLSRQIKLVRSTYPRAEIIVVVGFESEKIRAQFKGQRIRFVENCDFEQSNMVKSIGLALGLTKSNRVIVVNGDLVFTKQSLCVNQTDSNVVLTDGLDDGEIGANLANDQIGYFSYGVSPKWAQIVTLCDKELALFRELCSKEENSKLFTFEILNQIIDLGGCFGYTRHNSVIVDIDCVKDISLAKQLVASDLS